MPAAMPHAVQAICDARVITAADVLTLRRTVYAHTHVTEDEAEWMFALNAACPTADPAWDVFFVEALTDFCVHQMDPKGYVSDANALWLTAHLLRGGHKETRRELELLITILEKSTASPASLGQFAVACVRDAVLTGSGPLRDRRTDDQPHVCADDVALLRRAIFAFGAGGNVCVTREEAEMLCDINDATAQAANDPAWPDLFAKALANHLSMAAAFATPTADQARARERWLNTLTIDLGGFFQKMASGLGQVFSVGHHESADAWALRDKARTDAMAAAAPVTHNEARWLIDRLNRDGELSPAETALLRFLKADGVPLDPTLAPLLDRVA